MKSLEDRLNERSAAQFAGEPERIKQQNADSVLAIELQTHVKNFASNRMIPVQTAVQAGLLVIDKVGKKIQIRANAREEGSLFDIHVARRGDLEGLDEDAALDEILAWLLSS